MSGPRRSSSSTRTNHAVDMTLVDFDTEVRRTVFSNDNYPRLIERIRMRKPGGMTAFYDALAVYLRGASTQDGQKILVAYTDGGDTRSTITAGDVADLLKASDVTLYTLGYLEHQSSSYRSAAQMELQRFAMMTGGQAFFPTSLKELDAIYEKILKEMSARYILGYISTDTRTDGSWRPVEIKLKRPDLKNAKLRTRPGYFAPSRSSARCHGRAVHVRGPRTSRGACRRTAVAVACTRYAQILMASKYDHFQLVTDFELRGDQARAIDELVDGLNRGDKSQVLLGVTGSGKTFTMAQVHRAGEPPDAGDGAQQDAGRAAVPGVPALLPRERGRVLRQLLRLLPARSLRPATDSYIEKEATINDEIDRMRLSATRSLFERRDVIIVASVSCIYGLGSPEAYYGHDAAARARPAHRSRADPAQAGRDPVRAQRPRVRPRHLPRPRRHRRGLSVVRGHGAAHRAVRRRGRRADRRSIR